MKHIQANRIGLLLGILISIELCLLVISRFNRSSNASPEAYVAQIVSFCRSINPSSACYDREIPKLLTKGISFEQAFDVTRIIQSKDRTYAFCHVLGHELSAKETRKDPANWKHVVARCPSGVCSNGCIHGAFQERFRSEFIEPERMDDVKRELAGVCEPREAWSPTKLEQGACYHALGHLFMYMTNADINRSTGLCDELVVTSRENDFRRTCYDGAFMQLFQPLDREDIALISGKAPHRADHLSFCSAFSGTRHTACMSEGWPLYMPEIKDPVEFAKYCSLFGQDEQKQCYLMSSLIMVVQFQFDMERVKSFCLGLPQARIGACFASVATRFIEIDWNNIDTAAAWCAAAPDGEVKKACFDELVIQSTYTFHPGSRQHAHVCSVLPEPWKEVCTAKLP